MLEGRCMGDWSVEEEQRRRARSADSHLFRVHFEQEGDILALFKSATSAC
ncbi:Protein of unknown function [Magnetospira sp. QH-2]|nr:Protein of unknown function [Magnetospira sp. QH-2]